MSIFYLIYKFYKKLANKHIYYIIVIKTNENNRSSSEEEFNNFILQVKEISNIKNNKSSGKSESLRLNIFNELYKVNLNIM